MQIPPALRDRGFGGFFRAFFTTGCFIGFYIVVLGQQTSYSLILLKSAELAATGDSNLVLTRTDPEIRYRSIGHGTFVRTITAKFSLDSRDSSQVTAYYYSDTLHRSIVNLLRRSEPVSYRGIMVRSKNRWLWPVIAIGLSLSVVFSLFYVRSPS